MTTILYSITADIFQVRLPLPFALKIVNCYLIRDGDGWCIVDTGLHTPQAEACWRQVFDALDIGPHNLHRLVLTHCHPDHYGMAGWLQRYFRGNIAVEGAEREFQIADYVFLPHDDTATVLLDFFLNCGVPAAMSQGILGNLDNLRLATRPHPERVEYLHHGDELEIGRRRFRLLHTPGHSDGHLMLHDTTDGLLLCGDHVLQTITPNIGLWPATEPDPLGRYLDSLGSIADLDVRLALPGHGELITDWRGRIGELLTHHDERLAHMKAAIDGQATPFDVCSRVFDVPKLTTHEIRFAVAETLAHLEYLVGQGELARRRNGRWQYLLV